MIYKIITENMSGENQGRIIVTFDYRCDYCGTCSTAGGDNPHLNAPSSWVTSGKDSYCRAACMHKHIDPDARTRGAELAAQLLVEMLSIHGQDERAAREEAGDYLTAFFNSPTFRARFTGKKL